MFGRVTNNELQLRRQILEIVHDKRRHAVIGLKLPAVGQPLINRDLPQMRCQMTADCFQKIPVFKMQRVAVGRATQQHESIERVDMQHGHNDGIVAEQTEIRRYRCIVIELRGQKSFLQIDDPAGARHEIQQRLGHRQTQGRN